MLLAIMYAIVKRIIRYFISYIPEPIAKNNRTCTCPTLDLIKNENFQMELQDGGARGGFDWRLDYKRFPRLKYSLEHPTEPFALVKYLSLLKL